MVFETTGRRNFLKKLGGFFIFAAAMTAFFRYLSPQKDTGGILLREHVSKIPEGGALIFADKQLALLKLDNAVTAVSLTCTHLGCTVALDGDRFACPCHGSVFALSGKVIKGPAVKNLNFYETQVKNDTVIVLRRFKSC